jgi:uncharacterized membrane protein YhhN
MNHKITALFVLSSAFYCISTFSNDYPFHWVTKIIPILVLLATLVISFKGNKNKEIKLFIAGLVFCMGGDVFLAVDRENLFIFGLGSFLVGHIFYIAALLPLEAKNRLGLTSLTVYGVIIMSILLGKLGGLLIPVLAYMLVLLAMAATTMLSRSSNAWLIIGGVSFTASDSLIGLDKFLSPIPYAGLLIMVTYYLAQYALVRGFLKAKT